ncbi:hypothetical protein KIW84_040499 [Lathyrus oleraceus]|uniref:Uncharacterized protein n=1 Tax=Pisum sativum TaxID=3888 RepID=A0A9D4X667_PEA|nr:hypothetical protein KIW84_040499 [Pisum sativum]
MVDENHPVMEGIPDLTLNTHFNELMVLCETIVDFENLKDNGFNFSETLKLQGWKSFFERNKGPAHEWPNPENGPNWPVRYTFATRSPSERSLHARLAKLTDNRKFRASF